MSCVFSVGGKGEDIHNLDFLSSCHSQELIGVEAVGLDAVPSKVPMYQKFGFSPAFTVRFFSGELFHADPSSHDLFRRLGRKKLPVITRSAVLPNKKIL